MPNLPVRSGKSINNAIKTQIALTEELALRKADSLTLTQRESGEMEAIMNQRNTDVDRLNNDLEIASATRIKAIADEYKKIRALKDDLKSTAIGFLENSDLASAIDEFGTAADRSRLKFKDLGEEAVRLGTILNENIAQKKN